MLGFAKAVLLAAAALLVIGAKAEDGWRWGRATFYGIWWSIHEGSCGYGNIDYWQGTGWDVAAIPDSHYEYQWSCGKCYEVKCEPMNFKDNYGNHLDRSSACYDPHKVVTVTIVDSCPCNYAGNSYSNKRWCCGDMDHFDLSYHTYDKLAARHWGVIGLKYRPVQCPGSFRLENRHHLGRKLTEDSGDSSKGPQMYIIDERYEYPDNYNGTQHLKSDEKDSAWYEEEKEEALYEQPETVEAYQKLLNEFLGKKDPVTDTAETERQKAQVSEEVAGKVWGSYKEAVKKLNTEFVGKVGEQKEVKAQVSKQKKEKKSRVVKGVSHELESQRNPLGKEIADVDASGAAHVAHPRKEKEEELEAGNLKKKKLKTFEKKLGKNIEKEASSTGQTPNTFGSFKEAVAKLRKEIVGFETPEEPKRL